MSVSLGEGNMNRVLNNALVLLIIIGLISGQAAAEDQRPPRKLIIPFGRPGEVVFDAGKGNTFEYYKLVKGQSMGFAVEGPAQIEIRSRAGLTGPNVRAEYQVQVWDGEYLISASRFKSKAARAKLTGTNLLPSTADSSDFEVPLGVHNYRLWLVSEQIDTVFVRIYSAKPGAGEPAKVTLWPMEYNKLVHLYSKRNQTAYYLIDSTKGVKLKVAGPIEVIITARVNFGIDMEGRIGYSIAVREAEKEVKVLTATTSKSLNMAYQDLSGVVPSQPTNFILKVPAGTHIYDFLLKESAAQTVSMRFSMPEQLD